MREGMGGYGGITTMNQDQRQGKFYPHKNIFVLVQHPYKLVKCFDCSKQWESNEIIPAKCKDSSWQSAEELLK